MTVSRQDRSVLHQGNGVAQVFPFQFKIPTLAAAYGFLVDWGTKQIIRQLTGAEITWNGIGSDTGGNATLPQGPIGSGHGVLLMRVVPYTQEANIFNQDGFYPEVVEGALDALAFQIQQVLEETTRSVKVPVGVSAPAWVAPPGGLIYVDDAGVVQSSSTPPNEREQREAGDAALAALIAQGGPGKGIIFSTAAELQMALVDSGLNTVILTGRGSGGDALGGIYRKADAGEIQSADGAWWVRSTQDLGYNGDWVTMRREAGGMPVLSARFSTGQVIVGEAHPDNAAGVLTVVGDGEALVMPRGTMRLGAVSLGTQGEELQIATGGLVHTTLSPTGLTVDGVALRRNGMGWLVGTSVATVEAALDELRFKTDGDTRFFVGDENVSYVALRPNGAQTLGTATAWWSTVYAEAFRTRTSATPVGNGDLVIEATSNTQLTLKLKGSDGVVRSATLTLGV